jgi:hypothetical protein
LVCTTVIFPQNVYVIKPPYCFTAKETFEQTLSINAEHLLALKAADNNDKSKYLVTHEDTLHFTSCCPVEAKDYLISNSSTRQIVLINEAHHISSHRAFTMNLLEGFYRLGFRYFCAETFYNSDTLLNKRGYPTLETGTYVADPIFGEMVRKALKLGYKLIPYEAQNYQSVEVMENGVPSVEKGTSQERYIKMGLNIASIFRKDPSAKVLVHAGYFHINKQGLSTGYYIKLFTGIEPFSIDQVAMTEKSEPKFENEIYKLSEVDTPTIFLDAGGKPFVLSSFSSKVDAMIFHPRTIYTDRRPNWINQKGEKEKLFVNDMKINLSFPWKVIAYDSYEYSVEKDNAVPLDIIEIRDKMEHKPLMLPSNKAVFIQIFDTSLKSYSFNYKTQ